MTSSSSPFKVALVSMPWVIFNRPSIQLGTLKSYLEGKTDCVEVRALHPYLAVAKVLGKDLYHAISANVWICEALYAAILFPERHEQARQLAKKEFKTCGHQMVFDFDDVCAQLEGNLRQWAEDIDWQSFDLVGFSVCFNQLFATLAAVRELKKKRADLPIVLGGSSCHGDAAGVLFRSFDVDYMISGEGEEPLLSLCLYLAGLSRNLHSRVHHAGSVAGVSVEADGQVELSELAVPDYDDYFREMGNLFSQGAFIPVLPVEFSRGCWWRRCTFCNLNLQWSGYRFKKADKMAVEISLLAARYKTLDFTFTDNALPPKDSIAFFDEMRQSGHDYRFFAEIRADHRGSLLEQSRKGGLTSVQVGIEAFSNSLLRKFVKGVTVIENLAIMRDAAASGVVLDGNLIIEFPESTRDEVEETLAVLAFAFPFHPLSTASFFLGHGSPVDCNISEYGIHAKTVHPHFLAMLPAPIAKGFPFLIKGYRGDRQKQRKMWQPVVEKVHSWSSSHKGKGNCGNYFLSFRDGSDFLIIRQVLPQGDVLHHRLKGLSRRIYLACDDIVDLATLAAMFPSLRMEKIEVFLHDLVGKRLVFREEDRFLALASRERKVYYSQ
ncbi:MAG: RiPP maturation radical SAM C-methyltransferase [Pseudomonadota bacterium]